VKRILSIASVWLGLALVATAAFAQAEGDPSETPAPAEEEPDPVYSADLERLAEILGSLHYLTELCESGVSPWRNEMAALIAAESPSESRRARLIDRFNLGYSAFATVHRRCTDAAEAALLRYRTEGADLAEELATRYGPPDSG
jgi:uncharacterized protein (TIGR02301 family)